MTIEQTLGRHRKKGILVDSQLLLVWIVGSINPSEIGNGYRRTREYTIDDYVALNLILEQFSKHYTTPQILAEVSNLGGLSRGALQRQFFGALGKTIEVLYEKTFQGRVLNRHSAFLELGLPDVSILQSIRKGILLLTADLPLFEKANSLGLPVVNFQHIRQDYIV